MAIENKYCGNLPKKDSVGRYNGYTGSFTDKTGKFDKGYNEEINKLNEKYGMPVSRKKQ